MSVTMPAFPNMYLPSKDDTLVFALSIKSFLYLDMSCSGSKMLRIVDVLLVDDVGNAVGGRGGKAGLFTDVEGMSGMVVSNEEEGGMRVVFKAFFLPVGGVCVGCRGVVGPMEKAWPANEQLSFSWPPKNPNDSR